MRRGSLRSLFGMGSWLLVTLGLSANALAFPYVVAEGDSLARIAERFYGRVQLERVLVAANHLDRTGAKKLAPGMILEVPALTYHRIESGETWETVAKVALGHERRAIYLAESNGQKPWIQPELGQIIALPYNLAWVANGEESLATLAYRFLGGTKQAWALTQYNDLEKREIVRGEVLLLPLKDLPLTVDGRRAAATAAVQLDEQAHGESQREQTDSRAEVSLLAGDVRSGRYVAAVARGSELLVHGELSAPLVAHVERLLLEAYVALDAPTQARQACDAFRKLEPDYEFDEWSTSPKILVTCGQKRPAEAPAEAP